MCRYLAENKSQGLSCNPSSMIRHAENKMKVSALIAFMILLGLGSVAQVPQSSNQKVDSLNKSDTLKVVQILGAYLVTPAWAAYGAAGLLMPVLLLAIAAALWSYARKAAARGWLR